MTKHRSSPRIQAAQQQQQQHQQALNQAAAGFTNGHAGGYSTPVGASWGNGGNAPSFSNYVPQQPVQFQSLVPVHHGSPAAMAPGFQNQYQQPYSPQPQLQQPYGVQQQQPPQPFVHQPQIQNVFASPIITPANNPQTFQSAQFNPSTSNGSDRRPTGVMFGQGVTGVGLMTRILMALKSQIQSEEDWALAALMQVSFNSPNACNFRVQSTLADTVLKRIHTRCVEASERVKQGEEEVKLEDALNTPILTGKTIKEQQKVLEALLVVRNSSLEPENAQFLAHSELCRYIVIHGITLPDMRIYNEFKHLCLEIVEAISFHVTCDSPDDTLFKAVVQVLQESSDRSMITPALRSLARFLIRDQHNIAKSLPQSFITQVLRYLLIIDDELITASLDFLYQYTARTTNVSKLVTDITNTEIVTKHLVRLLTFGMAPPKLDYVRLPRLTPKVAPAGPPTIPPEILNKLLTLPEPERATNWIRSSYEYEATGEVTQISLWKAYEAQFETHARSSGARLLPAVDFIKNVTSAFQNSAAMVVNLPDGQKKFIIKGIVPREFPVAPSTLPSLGGSSSGTGQTGVAGAGATIQTGPPAFGVTVSLVLQNIGRSTEGKALLKSCTRDLFDASLLNPHVQAYIQELLDLIQAPPVQEEEVDGQDEDHKGKR